LFGEGKESFAFSVFRCFGVSVFRDFHNKPSSFILSKAEQIKSGKVIQTSPFTVAACPSSFILPHDFASWVVAPDIDPDEAWDVVR